MKEKLVCTKKNRLNNRLKRTKKRLIGGNSIKQRNYLFLDNKANTLQFSIPNSSFKANLNNNPNKHKNIELFEHQQIFMDSLLKKYTNVQNFEREGNSDVFINKGDPKVFYSDKSDQAQFSTNSNRDFSKPLNEVLYIATDVNNTIFFKIFFKKESSSLSVQIAPFVIIIYPKNGKLNIYLYTLLKSPSISEEDRRFGSDESTLNNSMANIIPKNFKDKVQVDLIKKISWGSHSISKNTGRVDGDDVSEYLISCSDWLGVNGERTVNNLNSYNSDYEVKKILKDMSDSWKMPYLRFPTSNQDPYYENHVNTIDISHIQNNLFVHISPFMTSNWWDRNADIDASNLPQICNIISNFKIGTEDERSYPRELIYSLQQYPNKVGGYLKPIGNVNPLIHCHNQIYQDDFESHLIGVNSYLERALPDDSIHLFGGAERAYPKQTPTTNIGELKEDYGDSDKNSGMTHNLESYLSNTNHDLTRTQASRDSTHHYTTKILTNPETFSENQSKPLICLPMDNYLNPTYYDIVSNRDYTFGMENNNGERERSDVLKGVNNSIKDNDDMRVGLKPFIEIEENPSNRFSINSNTTLSVLNRTMSVEKASYLWSGVLTIEAEELNDGSRRSGCYTENEDYYQTLLKMNEISQEFYNNKKSYFLFPHAQDFISMDSLVDLKYFVPPNFQDLMSVNRDTIVVSKAINNYFDDINNDFWQNTGYGVCQQNTSLRNMESNYSYVLNERFVLGHSMDAITMNNITEVNSDNLSGGTAILGSDELGALVEGSRVQEEDRVDDIEMGGDIRELMISYNLKSLRSKTIEVSLLFKSIFEKLGLINIPMTMKVNKNYEFLFMVYLLNDGLTSFNASNGEFSKWRDFYRERMSHGADKLIIDSEFKYSLGNYLQTFKDIINNPEKNDIKVPIIYKNLGIINIYNDKKKDVFIRSLFDNIIQYRQDHGLQDNLDLSSPEVLSFMELLMSYEENPDMSILEIISTLRDRVDYTFSNLFDSVGNLQGDLTTINSVFTKLSDYLRIPIFLNIVGDNYSKLLYPINDGNMVNNRIPLVLMLEEVSKNKYVSRISSFVDDQRDPKIFYESVPYEELRPYSELVIENQDNKGFQRELMKNLDSKMSGNIYCSQNFDLQEKEQIIITSIRQLEFINGIKFDSGKETFIKDILKIFKIDISDPISEGKVRYYIYGDEDSNIFNPQPIDIVDLKKSWHTIKSKIISSIKHSSCLLRLEFSLNRNDYKMTLLFLRDLDDPTVMVSEYVDMVKTMMLIEGSGNNIYIDEDSIDMGEPENKSTLLMNGVLLGYNKSIFQTPFHSDKYVSYLNINKLFKLILLGKSLPTLMDIVVDNFSEKLDKYMQGEFSKSVISYLYTISKIIGAVSTASVLAPVTSASVFSSLVATASTAYASITAAATTAAAAAASTTTLTNAIAAIKTAAGLASATATTAATGAATAISSAGLAGIVAASVAAGGCVAIGGYALYRYLNKNPNSLEIILSLNFILSKVMENEDFKKHKENGDIEEMMKAVDKLLNDTILNEDGKTHFDGPIKFRSIEKLLSVLNGDQQVIENKKIEPELIKDLCDAHEPNKKVSIITGLRNEKDIRDIKSLFLDKEHDFENVDLLNYIHMRVIEGDIKNRYIGKKVKVIKDEGLNVNLLNTEGYVIDYNHKSGEFKVRLMLVWGSKSLSEESQNKMKETSGRQKLKWEVIYNISNLAEEKIKKDLSVSPQNAFIQIITNESEKVIPKTGILGGADKKLLGEALEMFYKYNFVTLIKSRSSLQIINDKTTQIGGRLTLELALDMFRNDDFDDINYKLLIDWYNRTSLIKIFLIYITDLGRVESVYPSISSNDKLLTSDEIRFITINKEHVRNILAFRCYNVGITLDNIKTRTSTKENIVLAEDDINIGFDYFVVSGNTVSDRVTVIRMVYSNDEVGHNGSSYLVESIVGPKTAYVVNGSNLISELSHEYNKDKFLYSDKMSKLLNSNGKNKNNLSKSELERQMGISIIERINSKFDKFMTIFDSVDTLFTHDLESSDSKEFLSKFISNSLSTLDSLNSIIQKSKLSEMYTAKLKNIETRIQAFYNKHRDIVEQPDDDIQTDIGTSYVNVGIVDEDDYQGMIDLRYQQSSKLSTSNFENKMKQLNSVHNIQGVSEAMMTLYKKICTFLTIKNNILMGDQGQKVKYLQDFSFYNDTSPFEIPTSEFVEPTRGEFVYKYIEQMMIDLKERSEEFKDGDKSDLISGYKSKLERFAKEIEKVNPRVSLKEEKKKNEEKNKKDDGKKKFVIGNNYFNIINSSNKKESILILKKKMRIAGRNVSDPSNTNDVEIDLEAGEKLKFYLDNNKELSNKNHWHNFFKNITSRNSIITLTGKKIKDSNGRDCPVLCSLESDADQKVRTIELLED